MAEFANDENMAEFYLTLMEVEPFVHRTIEEVVNLPIDPQIIKRKVYFQEWLKEVDPSTVVLKGRDKLIAELDVFILTKKEEDVTDEEENIT